MLASSGYVCQVDADRCRGCELCVGYCQFGALAVHDGVSTVDAAGCMGCGACARQCPEGALSLRRDPSRGQPLEIQKLIAQGRVSKAGCRVGHTGSTRAWLSVIPGRTDGVVVAILTATTRSARLCRKASAAFAVFGHGLVSLG